MCESCINYELCRFRETAKEDFESLFDVQKTIPHPFVIVCKSL